MERDLGRGEAGLMNPSLQAPRVSVLMAVYNGSVFLRAAIDSVLAQTYRDFEFVIVDDGSSDTSRHIVESYRDPRIRLHALSRNGGLTAALNIGLDLCRGEFVARMDADDMCHPKRLAQQVCYMDHHPEVGILGTAMWVMDGGGRVTDFAPLPEDDAAIRFLSLTRNPFHHPTVMLRRDILERHGLRYGGRFGANEDFDLWSRLLPLTRGANLRRPLLWYRVHGSNVSINRLAEQQSASVEICRQRQREELGGEPLDAERLYQIFDTIHGSRLSGRGRIADAEAAIDHYLSFGERMAKRARGANRGIKAWAAAGALRAWTIRHIKRGRPSLLRRILKLSPLSPLHLLRLDGLTVPLKLWEMTGWRRPRSADGRGHLLVVVSSLRIGGTERHLGTVLPALVERGWTVSVVRLAEDGPIGERLSTAGISVLDGTVRTSWALWLPRPFRGGVALLLQAFPLVRHIQRRERCVVHAFLPTPVTISGIACALIAHKPFICSRRALNHYQRHNARAAQIERFFMRRATAVLGNSAAVMKNLRDEGVPPKRLGLIYNGIVTSGSDEDRETVRVRENLAHDAVVLIAVANLIRYKGFFDLIEALVLASARMSRNWTLLCVGRDDQGLSSQLMTRAMAGGIGDRIRLLGERHDVSSLFVCADVAISSSHEEGFSNSIIEAMCAGLPVIATNVGGSPEAVVDCKTGLLVPPAQPEAIAEAIVSLVQDDELRRRLGQASAARARAYFSMDECVSRYDHLYRAVLANPAVEIADIVMPTALTESA